MKCTSIMDDEINHLNSYFECHELNYYQKYYHDDESSHRAWVDEVINVLWI